MNRGDDTERVTAELASTYGAAYAIGRAALAGQDTRAAVLAELERFRPQHKESTK